MDRVDELLEEQRAYYDARAPEYDDWWHRGDRYRFDDAYERSWWSEVAAMDEWFDALGPLGDTLELAAGTGIWTERLVRTAHRITAVDASAATLELNRRKVSPAQVDYVVADIFEWRPTRRYDTVFFSFWLSHVPRSRFDGFWRLVDECLRSGGRVVFVDNAHPATAATGPERPPPDVLARRGLQWESGDSDVTTRTLADGRAFDIVKVWWRPAELTDRLASLGWSAAIATTDWAFVHGVCVRSGAQAS